MRKKQADCLKKLGEVGLESGLSLHRNDLSTLLH